MQQLRGCCAQVLFPLWCCVEACPHQAMTQGLVALSVQAADDPGVHVRSPQSCNCVILAPCCLHQHQHVGCFCARWWDELGRVEGGLVCEAWLCPLMGRAFGVKPAAHCLCWCLDKNSFLVVPTCSSGPCMLDVSALVVFGLLHRQLSAVLSTTSRSSPPVAGHSTATGCGRPSAITMCVFVRHIISSCVCC